LMSYSQFLLRGLISATSFTVVGTMCKIGTVIINCMIWDKHASMEGLIALFICIFSGLFYQQSPLRNPIPTHTRN
jgi:GDP-mannose transporter